jgi:hypothetical protein
VWGEQSGGVMGWECRFGFFCCSSWQKGGREREESENLSFFFSAAARRNARQVIKALPFSIKS